MSTSKPNPSIVVNRLPARALPTRSGAVSKLGVFPTYARQFLTCYHCGQPFSDAHRCRFVGVVQSEFRFEGGLGFSGSVSDTPTKVWNPILIDNFCHLDGDSSLQTELAL